MKRILLILTLITTALLPAFAQAGSTQDANPVYTKETIARFSERVQRKLASRGANVAIVGRVGRDPDSLPHGIDYTHVAYWVYSKMIRADGTSYMGYRVYNLYQTAENGRISKLVQDTPEDFFAGVFELNAGVIIPDQRLQQKLLQVITSPTYARLHNASYSVLANPRNARFQNCTEHTLDVLMASLYDTDNTAQIKANIAAYFAPQPVRINGIKRLLAPAASPAFTTVDHQGKVSTATFGSIARFMRDHNLHKSIYRQTYTQTTGYPI